MRISLSLLAACTTHDEASPRGPEVPQVHDQGTVEDTAVDSTGSPEPTPPLCDGPALGGAIRLLPDEPGDSAGWSVDAADVTGDGCAEVLVAAPWAFGYGYDGDAAAYLLGSPFSAGELPAVARTTYTGTDWALDYWGDHARLVQATRQVVLWGVVDGEHPAHVMPIRDGIVSFDESDADFDEPTQRMSFALAWDDCEVALAGAFCAASAQASDDTSYRGQVQAYLLPMSGNVRVDEDAYGKLFGDPNDQAYALHGRADLDGDGGGDLVVGAYTAGVGGMAASVLDFPSGPQRLWDVADTTYVASEPSAQFGLHVGAGDLDGDGLAEVAVGAHAAPGGGRLYVFQGGAIGDVHASAATLTVQGPRDGAWLGYATAIGDFDADGSSDVAVGAPRSIYSSSEAGEVYVLLGPRAGVVAATDADAVLVTGLGVPDAFGMRIAVGHLDGDGLADLVVGAPRDPTVGEYGGSVTLLSGALMFD